MSKSLNTLIEKAHNTGMVELKKIVRSEFIKNKKLNTFYIGNGTWGFNVEKFESPKIEKFMAEYDRYLKLSGAGIKIVRGLFDNANFALL